MGVTLLPPGVATYPSATPSPSALGERIGQFASAQRSLLF
jgi:hypothetical protein